MNRYRIVDKGTLQTVYVFAPDERSACVLANVPVNRATIYVRVWKDPYGPYPVQGIASHIARLQAGKNRVQTWERIELRPWEDHG